jgi:type IV secretion system protein VirB10
MTGASYTNPQYAPPVTGRSFKGIMLTLLAVALIVGGGAGAMAWWQTRTAAQASTPAEKPIKTWKSQSVYPTPQEERVAQVVPEAKPPAAAPLDQARLAAIERQNQTILATLGEIQRGQQAARPVPQPAATSKPAPRPPGPALLVTNKPEIPTTPASTGPEYTLAPGATKLPCVIETAINSDVEGYFTARVTTNVYDTATGRHLLVPQGSTILAKDQSSRLVYGDERLNTVSVTLALPNGQSVDLGEAPVTDEQGVAGLTGEVNSHFGRLLAAVLIQGVLKGGATVVTTAATEAAGAGQVASGVAGVGAQTGTQITGPLLNTRPTILVASGQLCNLLLIKPLTLPAQWEDGLPRERPKTTTTKGAKS